ncbi:MAG: alpha-L-arabinofuranosidase C-terminal domain-containing protein [Capsulimonas sp.]|uniref:alpha-L-arabinofuranosidase C-terminal domain-containing protein n=1 Tax=Capsulimonas sp. TaxID=2494211 RepID=UPI0032648FD6
MILSHHRTGIWAFALLFNAWTLSAAADTGSLTIKVNQPGAKISPHFYGLMTEEINHSYDGGLYGELLQNRAFQDNAAAPAHWSAVTSGESAATISLDRTAPVNPSLGASLRLDIASASDKNPAGVANEGYWGVPVNPKTSYKVSFYARSSPGFSGPLTVGIESADGKTTYARAKITGVSSQWKQYTATLKTGPEAPATTAGRFVIVANRPGTIWFSLVSLFPPTYKSRTNGNRIDLMEKLAAMNPGFLRMPGGNYLEGGTIAERFDWKKTIGPVEGRAGHQGPWGYRSTDGMGLLEFLNWCEDLNMQPVLAVYGGYSLGGEYVKPGPDLEPFVQDALDEIEYVTGDKSTKWGAERVRNGHPAPFALTYVEIGNEDGFDRSRSYDGRFTQFYDAIKAKYPKIKLMATDNVKTRTPDLIDHHYYRSATEMARDAAHYDSYSRTAPKVFVGEWASIEGSPTPTFHAALGDAAWLTGLERNADVVEMECYAPLLVNVNPNGRQWSTNLIGYDALTSFGSPSYYVQAMFGANRGDVVLPVEVQVAETHEELPPPSGKIGVGSWRTQAEFKDVQVTQGGRTLYQKDFAGGAADWRAGRGEWKTSGGVLRQSSGDDNCQMVAGDASWTDYTYRLKARKISGDEGFAIMFHCKDADSYLWWNVGGWGNTRTALQESNAGAMYEIGKSSPVTVETGRWYDVRIELQGSHIRCYLDDKLVQEMDDTPPPIPPLYAAASRDLKSGDIIVKAVNITGAPQRLTVTLQGVSQIRPSAESWVLTGQKEDVNSIASPTKAAPVRKTIEGIGSTFTHEFPASSVTVLRIKAKD